MGKTTFARRYLASIPECEEFVNADDIAASLIEIPVDERSIRAGRITIETMVDLVRQRRSFAVETTLSGRSLATRIETARNDGYHIVLLLFRLRVQLGGHDIPDIDVVRRYDRCYENFHELYKGISHEWIVYDASLPNPRPIQQGRSDSPEGRTPLR